MTRGRARNVLDVVASDLADARQQFIDAMRRDRADRGLTAATQAAKDATRGLIEDGPVKLVNTELARLAQQAEQVQRRAERWAQIARQLATQDTAHKDEADNADAMLRAVEEHAATVQAFGGLGFVRHGIEVVAAVCLCLDGQLSCRVPDLGVTS